MSSVMSILRRLLTAIAILFNFILTTIAISNLAKGVQGSYVDANYLLCIVSVLSVVIISIISFLSIRGSDWMPYKLAFEICWVTVILIFQFVTSVVLSADNISKLCRTNALGTLYPARNPCNAHNAVLAFDWMAVLFLLTHLGVLAQQVRTLSATTGLTALGVLRSQTKDLPTSSAPSSPTSDPEKNVRVNHLTLTASLSTGDSDSTRQKHRPPPLDLSKVASLPLYEQFAKAKAKADAAGQVAPTMPAQPANPARSDADLVRQPAQSLDRHQQMLQHMRDASIATNARAQQQTHQRSASTASSSAWTTPQDWTAGPDDESNQGSAGHRTRSMKRQWRSAESVPSAAAQQDKSLPPRPSVINRPDPRDRRPSQPDEYQTNTGGFWHRRGDRDSL